MLGVEDELFRCFDSPQWGSMPPLYWGSYWAKRVAEVPGSKKESKHSRIHPQWWGKRANFHHMHQHHLHGFMAKTDAEVEILRVGKSTTTEHHIPSAGPLWAQPFAATLLPWPWSWFWCWPLGWTLWEENEWSLLPTGPCDRQGNIKIFWRLKERLDRRHRSNCVNFY